MGVGDIDVADRHIDFGAGVGQAHIIGAAVAIAGIADLDGPDLVEPLTGGDTQGECR